jgi:branched-chain amino acid transport system ATP-binding protein
MMGAYIHRGEKEAIRKDLEQVCRLFPVLQERRHQRSGTLSGGEQQMLAIGRALMGRPSLLMLDEPSSGLAPRLIDEIFIRMQELNREGLTLFIVDQEILRVLSLSHRGYVMRNGRIVKEGSSPLLMESPDVQALVSGAKPDAPESSR